MKKLTLWLSSFWMRMKMGYLPHEGLFGLAIHDWSVTIKRDEHGDIIGIATKDGAPTQTVRSMEPSQPRGVFFMINSLCALTIKADSLEDADDRS